ncbi:VOC family protein [Rhizorhapis suberifaciens]|uniref:Putative 3-demethylubiquinone-9 3-methyltransferase (Glyoxalase superfamily) n=1 Tax=Rhizorhapis suberifaciens TaxID=13656 RepID=A0A840HQG4_9SPHN|nr:VOC family protein [Rhizorhapis suberifaciens]MBB4639860.1 putative 3-demethylubiquinone-9 3-methyltransferase (glyoxalase superfamily) [Rhizorhapis suberifaciens]
MAMEKITPCLWFDGNAEEAANFYVGVFPDSRIDVINRSPVDTPSASKGEVLMVQFTLAGRAFTGLNGGPQFPFTEAVSFQVDCADQAEVDHYWSAFTSDGGSESQCGWCKDRFGLSWQVVPRRMIELLGSADHAAAARAMQAMFEMTKMDIAALEAAAKGE